MSYAAEGYTYPEWNDLTAESARPERQSIVTILWFFLPVVLSGLSNVAGGIPALTDASFLVLTGLCVVFLIREFWQFSQRQGIGGILIYGGVLVWFCHDYFWNWLGVNFNDPTIPYSAGVIAKVAFYHCLFVNIMVAVYRYPIFRWADKFVVAVPEPATDSAFLIAFTTAFLFTISPFFIFVTEPFYTALWKILTFQGNDLHWTVHRTFVGTATNLNYDWGGYVSLILDFGELVGVLGAAYAILIAKSAPGKLFGWVVWFFWVAEGFPGLRRSSMAFTILPVVALLYYKYQLALPGYMRRINWKGYFIAGTAALGLLLVVQYETSLRDKNSLQFLAPTGATMFSEGLKAWDYFPDKAGGHYFVDSFPGADIVRPIPDTVFFALIDPIPRALWNNKPVPGIASWYSDFITGYRSGLTGTTVSSGAVGAWYFQYGPIGVIEGALLYGWLMGVAERALRRANGRPMGVIFTFAYATFMFRAYRDLWFHAIDPVLIGGIFLYVVIKFFGGSQPREVLEMAV